jgi:hypothetical protein
MRTLLARRSGRAALVPLFSLCLLAAACGDDLEPSDDGADGGDDGDDGGDDDQETLDVRIDGLDGPVDVFFDDSGAASVAAGSARWRARSRSTSATRISAA